MQWTYRRAWTVLIGSTVGTVVLFCVSFAFWHRERERRLTDEKYRVTAIVQTSLEREALKTSFLAQWLDLSMDRYVSLYAIHVKEAEKKLLSCPLISQAKVKRIFPSTLYIDYSIRKPIAYLADYKNVGIDCLGCIFPMAPFYSPKRLPEIYLGLPAVENRVSFWQGPIQDHRLSLAFEILHIFDGISWQEGMHLKRIDVSNAFASSAGRREIVLMIEDELTIRKEGQEVVCIFPKILRLPLKGYSQQLSNFFSLRRSMLEDYRSQIAKLQYSQTPVQFAQRIIDLRIAECAYVQK